MKKAFQKLDTYLYKRWQGIQARYPVYRRSFIWSLGVSLILYFPYISSSFVDLITVSVNDQYDSFFMIFRDKLSRGLDTGSLLFIPIGLSSSSYIDYVFLRKSNNPMVHLLFFTIVVIIVIMFISIDLSYITESEENFIPKKELIMSILNMTTFVSFIYTFGVKSLIFSEIKK